MTDEPTNHREIDERDRRTTKAYTCSCAPHQQPHCSYFRMGYCTDGHSFVPAPKGSPRPRPTLVVNNRNVYKLEKKKPNV